MARLVDWGRAGFSHKKGRANPAVRLGISLYLLDLWCKLYASVAQVYVVLQGKKITIGHAEELCKAERCVNGDFSAVVKNVLYARDRHIDCLGKTVRGNSERNKKFLVQYFAHRGRFDVVSHIAPLVVVHYLDIEKVAAAFGKADAPLVVYADAVLPLAVSVKRLKVVGGRYAQIFEPFGVVYHYQFSQGDFLNRVRKPSGKLLVVYKFGLGIRKTLYHKNNIHAKRVYCQAKTFDTRNSFLKLHGENGCVIDTTKMMCTRDVDYVYVEYDRVATCKGGQPLEGYRLEKKPHLCWRNRMPAYAGNMKCTLCGNMSIYSVEGETAY